MRTDKPLSATMPLSEWQELVRTHYSKDRQEARIAETVEFIVKYCISVVDNKTATFDGVWAYVDITEAYEKPFKKLLRRRLSAHLTKVQLNFKPDDKLVIDWGDISGKV